MYLPRPWSDLYARSEGNHQLARCLAANLHVLVVDCNQVPMLRELFLGSSLYYNGCRFLPWTCDRHTAARVGPVRITISSFQECRSFIGYQRAQKVALE